MKFKSTSNYSPRARGKVALNIFDFARRVGSTKLASALICGALMLAVVFGLVLIAARPAQAQTEKVLYSFAGGSDAAQPYQAGVVFDQSGNLYGVTQSGGAYGNGTIFELSPSADGTWTETVLYSFTGGADGAIPQGGLATDGFGTLYGTTAWGGDNSQCGTLFAYGPSYWGFQLLHTFDDITGDGCDPESDVMFLGGPISGTTAQGGGRSEPGTVFIYFEGDYGYLPCPGNQYPTGQSPDGQYGTALFGAKFGGLGTVFEQVPVRAKHFFSLKSTEGFRPIGNLATQVNADGVRVMYGATSSGGVRGLGAVYQLTEIKGEDIWAISLVHGFSQPDGASPWGGVVVDAAGNLYGTTTQGGTANSGTVFELTPGAKNEWTYTLLHSFSGGADGVQPTGSLVFDSAGNVYGTTSAGGTYGQGVVYEVTPPTATTTTVTSSVNPSAHGQAVTFTAAVASSAGVPPDGETVTFKKGTTVLGTGALSGGSASFTISTLPTGSNAITASYSGDSEFFTSTSNAVKQVVNAAYPTTTVLSSSLNSTIYGQAVTLTATVTSAGPAPTGRVSFRSGSSTLGDRSLSLSGVATLTTEKIPVGTDTLTAIYLGRTPNGESVSSGITQTVSQASVSMTLTSVPNPSTFGKLVKLTATLTSNGSMPSEQPVTFSVNGTTLGTAKIHANGVATLMTITLPQGADTVTAEYAGSADYSSASASVTQVVN